MTAVIPSDMMMQYHQRTLFSKNRPRLNGLMLRFPLSWSTMAILPGLFVPEHKADIRFFTCETLPRNERRKVNLRPCFRSSFFKGPWSPLELTGSAFPPLASGFLETSLSFSDSLSSFLYDGCVLHTRRNSRSASSLHSDRVWHFHSNSLVGHFNSD